MDFSALGDSLVMRGRLTAAPDALWAEAAVIDAYELDLPDGRHLSVDVMRRSKPRRTGAGNHGRERARLWRGRRRGGATVISARLRLV